MAELTYEELAARVREYEFWLVRIADKPREYRELEANFGGRPDSETAEGAYRKCGTLARVALHCFHRDLTEGMLKVHDHAERAVRDTNNHVIPGAPAPTSLADLIAGRA